jgi:hypothetical protein
LKHCAAWRYFSIIAPTGDIKSSSVRTGAFEFKQRADGQYSFIVALTGAI